MGRLFYGTAEQPISIPDHLLSHLRAVITTKLRRSESFTVTWRHPEEDPDGRSTIWVHCSIPLRFVFDSAEPEKLDPEFLRELARGANSSAGLTIDLEHEPELAKLDAA
jgi:hypothetical protein